VSKKPSLAEPRAIVELRLREPRGTYEADAHFRVLFPEAVRVAAIEMTRWEINRAARIAVTHEHHERHELRKARHLAQRLDRLLKDLERGAVGWFPEGDVAMIAADLSQGLVTLDPNVSITAPLVEALQNISALRGTNMGFQIKPSPPSRSDPLARAFLTALGQALEYWTGTQPPRAREGAFAKLAAAAWLDLGFPSPHPDELLEHWLGAKIERLYRI
jgi:hypothetical protein